MNILLWGVLVWNLGVCGEVAEEIIASNDYYK